MQLPAENRHLTRSGASRFFFPCGRSGVFLGNRSVMILGVSIRVRSPKPVIGIAAPESISIGQTGQRNKHEYHQCNKRNQFLFHFVFLLFQSISSSYIQTQVLSGKQQGNAVSPVRRKVSRLGSDQCTSSCKGCRHQPSRYTIASFLSFRLCLIVSPMPIVPSRK